MTHRIAQCSCGALQVQTTGEPAMVIACHCGACKQRTGAAFGVSVFFPQEQVVTRGVSKRYTRQGSRAPVHQHFCPDCGTSVYWHAEMAPTMVVVALGSFQAPTLPAPSASVWEESRFDWVRLDGPIDHFQTARAAAPGAPPPVKPPSGQGPAQGADQK